MRSADRTPTQGRSYQYQRVLALLEDHAWHTTPELMAVGGHRFSDCVHILRKKGHLIDTADAAAHADELERYCYRLRREGEGPPPGAHYVKTVMDTVRRGKNVAAAAAPPQMVVDFPSDLPLGKTLDPNAR